MKGKTVLIAILVTLGIPWLTCRVLEYWAFSQIKLETHPEETKEETVALPSEERVYQIPILKEGMDAAQMPLEEYLVGVLLGEMPPSFHPEALKAQAVVARTYTIKRNTQSPKHPDGALCIDPSCCQAYADPGSYTADQQKKIRQALAQTENLVLTYQGNLIDATYFSCSGGRTEAAVAVWGTDVPYLQSVESPGEELASAYLDSVTYTVAELEERLDVGLDDAPNQWFTDITYTPGGGVERMKIGGREFSGTELRSLLNLRSTVFTLTSQGKSVTITTRGYGHRVGMSQYGAEAMAQEGKDYLEILAHYYPGTTLESRMDN